MEYFYQRFIPRYNELKKAVYGSGAKDLSPYRAEFLRYFLAYVDHLKDQQKEKIIQSLIAYLKRLEYDQPDELTNYFYTAIGKSYEILLKYVNEANDQENFNILVSLAVKAQPFNYEEYKNRGPGVVLDENTAETLVNNWSQRYMLFINIYNQIYALTENLPDTDPTFDKLIDLYVKIARYYESEAPGTQIFEYYKILLETYEPSLAYWLLNNMNTSNFLDQYGLTSAEPTAQQNAQLEIIRQKYPNFQQIDVPVFRWILMMYNQLLSTLETEF